MPETLGIESLKQALKTVSDFREQIAQTKKFNFMSIFGFVDDLFALGAVITSWKNIVAEWKDRSPAELNELYAYAKTLANIPNEKIAKFVDDSFQWILVTISLVEEAKLLKK